MSLNIRRLCLTLVLFLVVSACAPTPYPYHTGSRSESSGDVLRPRTIHPSDLVAKGVTDETAPLADNRVAITPPVLDPQQVENMTTAAVQSPIYEESAPVLTPPAQKVTVSILLPLSGRDAALGQSMLKAAQLALFDIGDANFNLRPHDTKGTPEGTMMAMQDAVNENSALILGPLFGKNLRASKHIAQRANTPVIGFTTDWTLAGSGVYVMGFLPFAQVLRVSEYAAAKGFRNVAVIAPETDYGNIVLRTMQHNAYRNDMRIGRVLRYPAGMTDFSELIGNFVGYVEDPETEKSETPIVLPYDAIVIAAGGGQLRGISTMLSFYNVDLAQTKLVGTGLWDDPSLTREAALNKGWFSAPAPELRAGFEKRYLELYSEKPPRLATLAYDATALAAVLSQTPVRTASTGRFYDAGPSYYSAERLIDPRGFAGLDGVFRFRRDGLIERGLAVLEIQTTGMRVIDPAPAAFSR